MLYVLVNPVEVQQPTMNNTTECFLYEGILSQHEVHASESVAIEVCTWTYAHEDILKVF